jgi:hypothetical protein
VLESGIKQRGGGRIAQPEFTSVGRDVVIASGLWSSEEEEPQKRYMVMRIGAGKIVDMQDCRSRSEAEQYANRPLKAA